MNILNLYCYINVTSYKLKTPSGEFFKIGYVKSSEIPPPPQANVIQRWLDASPPSTTLTQLLASIDERPVFASLTQQVGRYTSVFGERVVLVFFLQLPPDVGVELLIEGLYIRPQAENLGLEPLHLIPGAPVLPSVIKTCDRTVNIKTLCAL